MQGVEEEVLVHHLQEQVEWVEMVVEEQEIFQE
jgi:hypothetical protein